MRKIPVTIFVFILASMILTSSVLASPIDDLLISVLSNLFRTTGYATAEGGSSGLIGHWKLDEGSGGTAYDSSGNGFDGIKYGASWASGVSGNALEFDGDGDYVNIGDLVSTENKLTVSAWINPSQVTNNDYIVGEGRAFRLGIGNNDEVYCWHRGDSSTGDDVRDGLWTTTSPISSMNKWYHLACVWDGTTGDRKIYVNGELEKTGTTDVIRLSRSSNNCAIGVGYVGTSSYFNGIIDDVRVYNRVLTADEIRVLYESITTTTTTIVQTTTSTTTTSTTIVTTTSMPTTTTMTNQTTTSTTTTSTTIPTTTTIVSNSATIYPTADSDVNNNHRTTDNRNSNYGTNNRLRVTSSQADTRDRRSFLKFDLSSLSAGRISSAKLYLYRNYRTPSGWDQAGYVEVRETSDSWAESRITWNNQPSCNAVTDTEYVYSTDKWYSWDVTNYVASQYVGDQIVSFCVKVQDENTGEYRWSDFWSKEYGSNIPYLYVEYDSTWECRTDEDCRTDCQDNKIQPYQCVNGNCALGKTLQCDKVCGAECESDEDCDFGTCNRDSCKCEEIGECTDSDDGKNYYVKGIVTDYNGRKWTDECFSNEALVEFYCDPNRPDGYNRITFNCPNGCEDGACVSIGEPEITSFDCSAMGSLKAQCTIGVRGLESDKKYYAYVAGSGKESDNSAIGATVFSGSDESVTVVVLSLTAGTYELGTWVFEGTNPDVIQPALTFWKGNPVEVEISQ